MGTTKINVSEVIGLNDQIMRAKNTVTNVKNSYNSTRNQIDGKILNRNNLYNRFQSVYNQIYSVENQISRIRATVENGATLYRQTDLKILSWINEINSQYTSNNVGSAVSGAAIAFETYEKKASELKEIKEKESDNWKIEGAVLSGSKTKTGEFLGFGASGTASGELLGGSVKTKGKATWDLEEKDAGLEVGIDAEGHLAKGELKGNVGIFGGEISGSVGNVGASGAIGATLYKDGKLSPSVGVEVSAEASVLKGEAEVTIGNEEYNGHVNASGSVLAAEAEASANIGMITYKDKNTGKTKTEAGVAAKVGAEAYLAEGQVSGGITIFGIDIDIGISGKAGGVGATAEARATTGGVSGEIGAGLGLGLGLELSIDWSDFSLW